ncbi:hypothetical protein [Leifsonia shinshuensis]
MVTPRLRPEQIAALRCAYCGDTFVCDPAAGHAILDAQAVELGLHTSRVHGTTRVQLVPITVEAWNADRLP